MDWIRHLPIWWVVSVKFLVIYLWDISWFWASYSGVIISVIGVTDRWVFLFMAWLLVLAELRPPWCICIASAATLALVTTTVHGLYLVICRWSWALLWLDRMTVLCIFLVIISLETTDAKEFAGVIIRLVLILISLPRFNFSIRCFCSFERIWSLGLAVGGVLTWVCLVWWRILIL